MKIVIPKFFLFIMMTIATSYCAAAADNSITLATKVEPSLDNEERATTTNEGFALSSSSSSLLAESYPRVQKRIHKNILESL